MSIQRKIRKTGNSTVVSIPKDILEKLNAGEGDNLEFVIEGEAVVIRKEEDSQKNILTLSNEMFEKYDKTMRDLVER
ncbi:AbrB/MazE/SpoVT family DNA-binding domain-containing protein [Salinicoccus roseus]|uniref:AbrB/MazE/SpoVT family DNA-binding domain-containing protein n=1 Tax=Salinicoccus roseus TaxID=45670 RepID=UPI001CA71253|nr:AbrB/MazE/SpoVT family DNA-binding domain-containing protein [Salinicoccus roseus]MBY8909055.1 AbrB/MazE/SpoVT family DNA-binding domain-containing protein [Salinicoccus roseus]